MDRISIKDAEGRLGDLIDRAARGEEIEITRRGAPVARLSASAHDPVASLRATRARIRERGDSFTWAEIASMRDEGRR